MGTAQRKKRQEILSKKGFGFLFCIIGVIVVAGCNQKGSDNIPSPSVTNGNSNDVQIVQSDVSRLLNAVYVGDADTVLRFTHSKIIKLMGGEAQAKVTLKDQLQQFQTLGMKLESRTFPNDPTFLKTDLHLFAIVPTKTIIEVRGQRLESLNYQFGVREAGATNWTYIEGSRINSTNVNRFFSDFPSGFKFPDFYRIKL
jgi:hypothetical protein